MKLNTLSPNARILKRKLDPIHKQGMAVIFPHVGYKVAVHDTCACNELLSLHNRHLVDRSYIGYDDRYFRTWSRKITRKWKFGIEKVDLKTLVDHYVGRKRKIYAQAAHNLINYGLTSRHFRIKAFIKQDKYSYDAIFEKIARLIQARSPEYNLAIGCYLHPYEKEFYAKPGMGPSGTRSVTKGLNSNQIADLFIEKTTWFEDPVFVEVDAEKFDSTVRVEHLRAIHAMYLRTFKSRTLRDLLHQQLSNVCYTRGGLKYTVKGTRMSGDFDTGLGNTALSEINLTSFLYGLKHELMIDGDDSVIIIERRDLDKLRFEHFELMGFSVKYLIKDDICEVDYCKSRIVLSNNPVMCRDPCRALSLMGICGKRYHPTQYREWISSVFTCLYYTNPGMPIFSAFKQHIEEFKIYDDDYIRKMEGVDYQEFPIDREAFARTWHIGIDQQLEIEAELSQYTGYVILDRKLVFRQNGTSDTLRGREDQQSSNARISQRFCSLYPSDYEFWIKFGTWHISTDHAANPITAPTAPAESREKENSQPKTEEKRKKNRHTPEHRKVRNHGGRRYRDLNDNDGIFTNFYYGKRLDVTSNEILRPFR